MVFHKTGQRFETHPCPKLASANWCWHICFHRSWQLPDVVKYEHRLLQRTQGWWEAAQWSLSYSHLEKHPTEVQLGGSGILLTNLLVHCTQWPDNDSTGLGCWSWFKIQGQANHTTHIISMYRQCESNDPTSTYQQHIQGLAQLWQDECPCQAVLDDLVKT